MYNLGFEYVEVGPLVDLIEDADELNTNKIKDKPFMSYMNVLISKIIDFIEFNFYK